MQKKLYLATRNVGKIKEMRSLLSNLSVEVLSVHQAENLPKIIEDRLTFSGNAEKKARTICRLLNEAALADDSGLEVDFLGGKPGVFSARFAGEGAGDSENNALLLKLLNGVPMEKRTARFRCAIAIAVPGEKTVIIEETCEGYVAEAPRGTTGFGYDPLFVCSLSGRTFAEMDLEEKNLISHRGKALRKACQVLQKIFSL